MTDEPPALWPEGPNGPTATPLAQGSLRPVGGALAILSACWTAWHAASAINAIILLAWKVMTVPGNEEFRGIAGVPVALLTVCMAYLGYLLLSLPAVVLLVSPISILISKFFSHNPIANMVIGAVIGVFCAFCLYCAFSSYVAGEELLNFADMWMASIMIGAIYGASSGYFVTRTLYA